MPSLIMCLPEVLREAETWLERATEFDNRIIGALAQRGVGIRGEKGAHQGRSRFQRGPPTRTLQPGGLQRPRQSIPGVGRGGQGRER